MTDLIEKPALAISRALCKANPSFQHSAALDMRALLMAATACIETLLDLDEEAIEAACYAHSPTLAFVSVSARENMRAAFRAGIMKTLGRVA